MDVAAERRLAPAALIAGLLLMAGARVAMPAAPPLYDGVVVVEPYRWLAPAPSQVGGAQGASATLPVSHGKSPLVAVATPEMEPQAQVFAVPGELTVPPGARSISVSIEPVPPEGVPTDGHVDGNVYRISVTDDRGRPLAAPVGTHVSVVLRATDPHAVDAAIARYSGGAWQPLETSSQGVGGGFLAVVREFGDFAVITPGSGSGQGTTTAPGASPGTSALVAPTGATSPTATSVTNQPAGGSSSSPAAAWAIPVVVAVGLLLVGTFAWARRRGRRRGQEAHRVRRR